METESCHENFTEMVLHKLRENLPAVFSRREVQRLLGGAIAPGTLANLGKDGPRYFIINKNAVYEKDSFLEWLRTRITPVPEK